MQQIIEVESSYKKLDNYLKKTNEKKLFLVCGESINKLAINEYFNTLEKRLGIQVVRFSEFQPNPKYESVVEGVQRFNQEGCRLIIAVGGGSAMDVAKCIKLYSNMNLDQNYLDQPIIPNNVTLMAMPTTAGTGSEATRFAVIYYNGEKQSVTDDSCIPSTVLVDPSVLETLPEDQKKATMLDALCHATESFWSVNANKDSQVYADKAIRMILENYQGYLDNTKEGNKNMLKAANIAGRAINITQTTAGHAMCYKLTSLYGISHGYAAALCVSKLFPYMIEHVEYCTDSRGESYLVDTFARIADAYGCENANEASQKFDSLLDELNVKIPLVQEEDYDILIHSVNSTRLKNNPVELDIQSINRLYHQILKND